MEKADFLGELLQRNPNMRRTLMEMRRKHKADVQEATAHLQEIREVVGLPADWEPTDDSELLLASEAAGEKRRHDAACAECPYTVETCERCRYNAETFRGARYSNTFLRCIPACAKYKVRLEQRRIAKLIGESGMGARFQMRTFATFREDAATETAKRLAQTFCADLKTKPRTTGLMLIGPYGCGKTHLAAAILHQSAEDGIHGIFVVVPELLAKIRSSYNAHDGKADEIIEAAKEAPLLVLDDLGAEKASEWVKEQLYMLINHRYEHMMPTVITTNNDGAELEAELGRRTLSRLAEMTVPVKINAGDYRMKLAGQAMRAARAS
nr:MAG TPA: Replicative helicase [Caudoviricetes sp.]